MQIIDLIKDYSSKAEIDKIKESIGNKTVVEQFESVFSEIKKAATKNKL
ncbi:hypothetical protein [uncultured Ruminococcus sp.]|nr:hypothetical protein [uncultured Ruminococcus sp.]